MPSEQRPREEEPAAVEAPSAGRQRPAAFGQDPAERQRRQQHQRRNEGNGPLRRQAEPGKADADQAPHRHADAPAAMAGTHDRRAGRFLGLVGDDVEPEFQHRHGEAGEQQRAEQQASWVETAGSETATRNATKP